ncbi:MAG: hypothetical protein L3J29_02790 [Cyclobacteriaceae bacterium]|nr:hypothetical protein [Cyclobacteriaceae bacterium]
MKKIFFTLLLSFLLFSFSNAQILNFNKGLLQNDSVKWLGKLSVFFTLIDQEVSVANMGYNVDVIRKFKNHSVMAISKLSFATSNNETLLSDGYAHVRAIFNRNERFGEEVYAQIQYNAIRGLEDRNLIGAGMRVKIYDKNKYGVIFGSAIIKEWENWNFEGETTHKSLWKTSNYISLFGDVNNHFHFNVISYYQATYTDFFSPRVSLEVNVNLNITAKLIFTSNFTMAYDNAPVIPIKSTIYKFKNGIGYRF